MTKYFSSDDYKIDSEPVKDQVKDKKASFWTRLETPPPQHEHGQIVKKKQGKGQIVRQY